MNNIGVYLHLPFCKQRCLYCDFYSTNRLDREEDYVKSLCRHIALYAARYPALSADTVYFGGGTPSLLQTKSIEKLLDAVHRAFPLTDAQITAEANPATLDEEKIRDWKALGINRISLGMQSVCDNELRAIGRLHTAQEALRTARLVQRAGIPHLSLDLMYALPYQTEKSFRRSVLAACESGADHVSAYCLTLSEQVPLARLSLPQAGEQAQQAMYEDCCEILEQNGFYQYEISNFARPGCHSRHNLKYWLRHPTLGFGAGAYSFYQNRRWSFCADLDRIIAEDPDTLIEEEEILSQEDAAEETLILSLRMTEGLRFSALEQQMRPEAFAAKKQHIEKKIALWEPLGLVRRTDGGFTLTRKGFFVSNAILSDLI